jgi:hypothetical protein
VYENGSFYEAEVLDLSQDLLLGKFLRAASRYHTNQQRKTRRR